MIPRPPISTLFPYTTLFRSYTVDQHSLIVIRNLCVLSQSAKQHSLAQQLMSSFPRPYVLYLAALFHEIKLRSEEHTSELQSRGHLVCRLLLEKKKTNIRTKY